eukprot:Pompholyxophrys_sp_v1_NODE_280_length_871_cov_30.926566.p1 type:complete len:142 gc:universal NODE_280_length_871_cov_30.926566:451-26(-)
MNIHCLRHLSDCVYFNGPLWAYSCYPSESVNGLLKRNLHGTYQFQTSLIETSIAHIYLSSVYKNLNMSTACSEYVKRMDVFDIPSESGNDIHTYGGVKTIITPNWCIDALQDMPALIQETSRLVTPAGVGTSASYTRSQKL